MLVVPIQTGPSSATEAPQLKEDSSVEPDTAQAKDTPLVEESFAQELAQLLGIPSMPMPTDDADQIVLTASASPGETEVMVGESMETDVDEGMAIAVAEPTTMPASIATSTPTEVAARPMSAVTRPATSAPSPMPSAGSEASDNGVELPRATETPIFNTRSAATPTSSPVVTAEQRQHQLSTTGDQSVAVASRTDQPPSARTSVENQVESPDLPKAAVDPSSTETSDKGQQGDQGNTSHSTSELDKAQHRSPTGPSAKAVDVFAHTSQSSMLVEVSPDAPISAEYRPSSQVAVELPSSTHVRPTVDSASPATAELGALDRQLADHVLSARQSIHQGRATLEVTLDPPELGKLTIELTQQDERLTAKVLVAEATTLDSIKRSLPSMMETLNDAGVNLANLELGGFQYGGSSPNQDADGVLPATVAAMRHSSNEDKPLPATDGSLWSRVNVLA